MIDSSARILVIEDSLIQVRLVEALLNQHGDGEFTLECADTLKAGLRLLVRGGIDVVLLDLTLPHRSRNPPSADRRACQRHVIRSVIGSSSTTSAASVLG